MEQTAPAGVLPSEDYRVAPAVVFDNVSFAIDDHVVLAAKPNLLLCDDPTTGLDPITATTVDDEIVKLRDLEQVTAIVVRHQIRDAVYVASHEAIRAHGRVQILAANQVKTEQARFMVLHEGRIYFEGTAAALQASRDRYLQKFLFMTLADLSCRMLRRTTPGVLKPSRAALAARIVLKLTPGNGERLANRDHGVPALTVKLIPFLVFRRPSVLRRGVKVRIVCDDDLVTRNRQTHTNMKIPVGLAMLRGEAHQYATRDDWSEIGFECFGAPPDFHL